MNVKSLMGRMGLMGLIMLLSGCASYQSKFVVAGNSFSLPKDAHFSYLQVSVPSPSGVISLTVSNGDFRMNPTVIDSKTAHDVAIIGAVVQGAGSLIGAGAGVMKPIGK